MASAICHYCFIRKLTAIDDVVYEGAARAQQILGRDAALQLTERMMACCINLCVCLRHVSPGRFERNFLV